MKNLFIISTLLLCGTLRGQETSTPPVRTENIQTEVKGDSLLINMDLVLPANLKVSSNRLMIFTPVLENKDGETALKPVYVYGRKRQIINERKNRLPIEGSTVVRRTNGKEQTVTYHSSTLYAPWMNGTEIHLESDLCGCGNDTEERSTQYLATVAAPVPAVEEKPAIVEPAPVKRTVKRYKRYEGKGYIDFPVNITVIYPGYRKNPTELARIDSTLEAIGIDKITHITLHGYASPESPYKHNARLAEGRTEALKKYIADKYHLADSTFTVEHTPEDWEGLIRLAEQCNWPEKEEILRIARSDEEPDKKEAQLKLLRQAYPKISKEWWPALRHTDYSVVTNEVVEEEE